MLSITNSAAPVTLTEFVLEPEATAKMLSVPTMGYPISTEININSGYTLLELRIASSSTIDAAKVESTPATAVPTGTTFILLPNGSIVLATSSRIC
jgi:hypothetical protein